MKKIAQVEIDDFELDQALLKNISSSTRTNLTQLADATGVADVYQRLTFFQNCGVAFSMLDQNFCQLQNPLDLLNADQITASIPQGTASLISSIEQHHVIDSTNSALLNLPAEQRYGKICITEYQTSGRGRRGRQWLAPFASGLCLSLGWQFQNTIKQLQLISFLPAVALIRVLHKMGLKQAGVKWPNDVICHGEKLAGVLIEISSNNVEFQEFVIGIGLNVYNRSELLAQIPQPWTTIDQQLEAIPTRNKIAAMLITELLELIQTAEQNGLEMIRDEWREYDLLRNTPIYLLNGKQKEKGISRGINNDGSLTVEVNGKLRQFLSGEVSIRALTPE